VTTQCYIPEDYKLHTHRRENLKSHISGIVIQSLFQKQITGFIAEGRRLLVRFIISEEWHAQKPCDNVHRERQYAEAGGDITVQR
jgi:hypothetical protein